MGNANTSRYRRGIRGRLWSSVVFGVVVGLLSWVIVGALLSTLVVGAVSFVAVLIIPTRDNRP